MDDPAYKALLAQTRLWYKTIGKVYCPCLKEDVIFNSKGFYHLRYDGQGKERPIAEQIMRFKLMPFVIPLIKQSKEIYTQKLSKDGKNVFFTLQGIIESNKIRAILIKKLNGRTIYFSVMRTR